MFGLTFCKHCFITMYQHSILRGLVLYLLFQPPRTHSLKSTLCGGKEFLVLSSLKGTERVSITSTITRVLLRNFYIFCGILIGIPSYRSVTEHNVVWMAEPVLVWVVREALLGVVAVYGTTVYLQHLPVRMHQRILIVGKDRCNVHKEDFLSCAQTWQLEIKFTE